MSRISFNTTSGSIKFNTTSGSIKFYPDTLAPDISDQRIYFSGGSYYCEWKVKNNDPSTAHVTSEFMDSTPDEFTNILGTNMWSSFNNQFLGGFAADGTIYAFAQASGKGPSDYVSVYVSLDV